jgi:hypothetical protein
MEHENFTVRQNTKAWIASSLTVQNVFKMIAYGSGVACFLGVYYLASLFETHFFRNVIMGLSAMISFVFLMLFLLSIHIIFSLQGLYSLLGFNKVPYQVSKDIESRMTVQNSLYTVLTGRGGVLIPKDEPQEQQEIKEITTDNIPQEPEPEIEVSFLGEKNGELMFKTNYSPADLSFKEIRSLYNAKKSDTKKVNATETTFKSFYRFEKYYLKALEFKNDYDISKKEIGIDLSKPVRILFRSLLDENPWQIIGSYDEARRYISGYLSAEKNPKYPKPQNGKLEIEKWGFANDFEKNKVQKGTAYLLENLK